MPAPTAKSELFDSHTPEEAKVMRPPRGFAWAYNRRDHEVEFPYDGRFYQVPAHRAVLLPDVVARHGRKRTVEKIDYVNRRVQRAIVALYHPSFGEVNDPEFGEPLAGPAPIELVDRSQTDNLLGAPSVDANGKLVPTTAKVINVSGVTVGAGSEFS